MCLRPATQSKTLYHCGHLKMHSPQTVDDLRKLLEFTEQCVTQAITAKREAVKYLEHYRYQVEEFKKRAPLARTTEMRDSLLRIAASHERLVRLAEGLTVASTDPSGGRETPANDPEQSTNSRKQEERLGEQPIAQALRHVIEGRERVGRQEALLKRLSGAQRLTALAAEANEVLETLKHTLDLAQQHLAIKLKK